MPDVTGFISFKFAFLKTTRLLNCYICVGIIIVPDAINNYPGLARFVSLYVFIPNTKTIFFF